MSDVFIYTLSHPVTGEVRYVGKTLNPSRRFQDHIFAKKRDPRQDWIRSLQAKGLVPVMDVIETVENSNDEDWQEVERFWITTLRFCGARLLNMEDGGNGGKRLSAETRRKIGDGNRGKVHTPESRLAMRLAHLGKGLGNKANVGRIPTPEARERMSIASKGKPKSEAHRLAISAGKTGRKASPEARAKMSIAQRGSKKPRKSKSTSHCNSAESVAVV